MVVPGGDQVYDWRSTLCATAVVAVIANVATRLTVNNCADDPAVCPGEEAATGRVLQQMDVPVVVRLVADEALAVHARVEQILTL